MREWTRTVSIGFTDEEMTHAQLKMAVKAMYPDYVYEGGSERIRPGDPVLLGKEGEVHTHSMDACVVIRLTETSETPRYVPPNSTPD